MASAEQVLSVLDSCASKATFPMLDIQMQQKPPNFRYTITHSVSDSGPNPAPGGRPAFAPSFCTGIRNQRPRPSPGSKSLIFAVVAEAEAVPDYYTAGAQEPGRGQHYPLVPPKRCPSPPPIPPYAIHPPSQSGPLPVWGKPADAAKDIWKDTHKTVSNKK